MYKPSTSRTLTEMAKPCDDCGETGRIKARASNGTVTKLFCHDEERSCYNYRRGRYFEEEESDEHHV